MKPRILLINPPIYDFSAYDFWLKPYGLLRAAGFLRGQADFSLFDFLDRLDERVPSGNYRSDSWGRGEFYSRAAPKPAIFAAIERHFRRFGLARAEFRSFLAGHGPFEIALVQTGMTYWYLGVQEIIDDIRAMSPKTKIILGGVYATICAVHARGLGALLRRNIKVYFHTPNALNARFIDRDLAQLMVDAGFKNFYLGFESSACAWQKKTGGKVYSHELERAVTNLISARADPSCLHAYLIVGSPNSAEQAVEDSMNLAHTLGIKVMLSEFSPIPGTPDGEQCHRWIDLDEPLWHSKTAFTLHRLGAAQINRLKRLASELNHQLRKSTTRREAAKLLQGLAMRYLRLVNSPHSRYLR